MNVIKSSFAKFKLQVLTLKNILVSSLGVVLAYIILSIFVTVGLMIIGLSAVFLFIPLTLYALSQKFDGSGFDNADFYEHQEAR